MMKVKFKLALFPKPHTIYPKGGDKCFVCLEKIKAFPKPAGDSSLS